MAKAGEVVDPKDAHEHGYWGTVPDETPNEAYTVAGVTGGTAKAADAPAKKPAASK